MKKLLSLLTLLVCTIGAAAQDWTVVTGEQPMDRQVIIADLQTNLTDNVYSNSRFTVGAFVGDECRWKDSYTSVTTANGRTATVYQIEIWKNADEGEQPKVSFRAFDTLEGIEYELTPSSAVTWDPENTIGSLSDPFVLTLTAPTSYTLNPFEVECGKDFDLTQILTIVPTDAKLPLNAYWTTAPDNLVTISGNTLTAGDEPRTGVTLYLHMGSSNNVPRTTFDIVRHATAINIVTESYDVILNESAKDVLTSFMTNWNNFQAYSLTPSDATDAVKWELADTTYIQAGEAEDNYTMGTWTPLKRGTTQIRPYVEKADGTKLYPADNKWITINIIQPVTDAYLNWPLNDGRDKVFKANVGDEGIYEHLAWYVAILPDDATDKTFTITDASENEGEFFEVDSENKTITALKAGRGKVLVQPNGIGGEDLGFEVIVEIYDPLKEISFTEDPLIFRTDEDLTIQTIEQAIADNIINWQMSQDGPTIQKSTITVEGALDGSGTITEDGPFVSLTNKEVPKGESTVTVTLSWNDYSEYDGTDENIKTADNGGQSFTVKIIVGLESFTIVVTPNDDDPNRGTITITPVPEDADFDWADYEVTVGCDDYDGWDAISIKGDEGSYDYAAQLPGEYYVTIDSENYEYFIVPEKVSFEAGWQWKSNPWGIVEGSKQLTNFFGDNLAEARTYNELLFNDAEWGYWGSLYTKEGYAIEPYQMYKVKMKAAAETYLYKGVVADEIVYSDLAKGWNWIGSPYFYKRLIEKAFNTNYAADELVEGMVIQSKTGSAEFNGSTWSGQLKTIDPGQGYYLYLPKDIDVLHLAREISDMEQGDDVSAARGARQSVWSYDHSRFASNMSVVAELSDLTNAEQFTIGAFVGDECRGEGIFEKGLAFITVHTDGGEQVSFRLHNELTGEFFDIDQTIRSGAIRVGSLKAPVQLTSQAVVTGIKNIENGKLNIESYDLGGRRVNNSQSSILNSQLKKGLTIQRRSDGSVRKVVK